MVSCEWRAGEEAPQPGMAMAEVASGFRQASVLSPQKGEVLVGAQAGVTANGKGISILD